MGLNSSTGQGRSQSGNTSSTERLQGVYSSYSLLVLWTHQHSPLHRKLSLNITRELCSYLTFQRLITILPKSILRFDVVSNQWKLLWKLRQKAKINEGYACTFIAEDRLFICGGGSVVSTFLFHADDCAYVLGSVGDVHILPNMLVPHHWHGVLYSAGEVFVFGGRDSLYVPLRTCEKFLLASNQWQALPDMHKARCGFNPCWYSSVVYLCGGKSRSIETFNPRSNVFTLLSDLILPEAECCTTVVTSEGELVVVSIHFLCKLEESGRFAVQKHMTYVPFSTCTPLVSGELVYTVSLHSCYGISLATGEVLKESVCG